MRDLALDFVGMTSLLRRKLSSAPATKSQLVYLLAAFQLFGLGHLSAIALTLLIPLGLIALAGRFSASPIAWGLITLLVGNKLAVLGMAHAAGELSRENAFPMHLCDWATVAVVVALIRRTQLPFELAYFWGLAGTLQAVLTPDLAFGFEDPGAWTFFISHSGVIAAVIFVIGAFKMRPWPVSIMRAFAWSQVYLVAAALVNWLSGANYGYLRAKPETASLLDHLGPWPFYILSLEALALLFFVFYYAPFFVADRVRKRSNPPAPFTLSS